nr:PAS domain S-box protein [Methylomarinum sp. Ch1-1]MDP4519745.1 PAS domain S-box protein [Methylomarinum sp. Ch1-1]
MRQRQLLRIIGDNFLLISIYYLAGHLSMHFLATPPSNAAVIWPPAGIALAAVWVRGYRLLPAVFIGDLIIAIEIFGFGEFSPRMFSLMVGFQACLSAALGAFMINRCLKPKNPLLDNRSIFAFFCLGGPLSQLLSALIAIGSELWLGIINRGDIMASFFTWWLGSSVGVILFAPLVLIFIAQPRSIWRPRIIPVAFPLLFLCINGVWAFNVLKTDEQDRLRRIFAGKVDNFHRQVVKDGLALVQQEENIRTFITAMSALSAREFKIVSQAALKEHNYIKALAWAPASEFGPLLLTGELSIAYIEPHLPQLQLQQFKPANGMNWPDVLQRIRDSGQLELIGPTVVDSIAGPQSLAALLMPVYRDQHESRALSGYLSLFFDYRGLKEQTIDFAKRQHIELNIIESHSRRQAISADLTDYGFEIDKEIDILSRRWLFNYKPSEVFINTHTTLSYWWIFIAGFCIISMLGFILLSVTGQTLQTQKLVEEKTRQLNKQHRLLDSILNNVREGIISCDSKGRLTMLNRTAQQQYGLELGNLSPRKWLERYQLFEMDGQTQLTPQNNPLNLALAGKEVHAFEMIMKNAESNRTLSVNSLPLRDEHEGIIGAVASFQDISCQKQYVDELKKLSWAVQHSPSAVMMTDTQGRIEYVNDKFVEINGYTLEDVIKRSPRILKSGRTPETIYQQIWQTLAKGEHWQGELLNQRKNGELYWAKQLISPVKNEQGKVTHFIALMEDVTEVRKKPKSSPIRPVMMI